MYFVWALVDQRVIDPASFTSVVMSRSDGNHHRAKCMIRGSLFYGVPFVSKPSNESTMSVTAMYRQEGDDSLGCVDFAAVNHH